MNRYNFLALLLVGSIVIYYACKKVDVADGHITTGSSDFFETHNTNNKSILAVRNFLIGEENKYHFAKKIIDRIGYPYWDKSLVFNNVHVSSTNRTHIDDSAIIVYVPFVRSGENYVNATMMFKMATLDTTWRGVCDWQYNELGFDDSTNQDKWIGRDVYNALTTLDYAVFGTTQFDVTDGRLFDRGQPDSLLVTVDPTQADGRSFIGRSAMASTLLCHTYQVCETIYHGFRNSELSCQEALWCTTIWSSGNEGGWILGEGNGGGGGSGGGGGYIPPQCQNSSSRGATIPECPPRAWHPRNGSPWQNNEPIDSILSKSARAINQKLDSIFNLAMNSGKEWGFVIVKRNDSIYAVNIHTDNNPTQIITRRFFHLQIGEVAIGDAHVHQDTDSIGRSFPSGGDIEALRSFRNQSNYFHFVDAGNVRYALVIENTSLAQSFFNNIPDKFYLNDKHEGLALADPAAYTNWRLATERALIQLIGTSSSTGIAIYKSTNSAKTTFEKIY